MSQDASTDPKQRIAEAMQEVRAAMGQLREGVVLLVMRRNRLSDDAKRLERLVADLKEKAQLAEQGRREQLAAELRNELALREAELARARQHQMEADVEAETAKSRLPDEEARLAQQLSDLQTQLVRLSSSKVLDNALGGGGADHLQRAEERIRALQQEAQARDELAGAAGGVLRPQPVASEEERAEEALAALEARLNPQPAAEEAPETAARFLEFNIPDADAEVAKDDTAEENPLEATAEETPEEPEGVPQEANATPDPLPLEAEEISAPAPTEPLVVPEDAFLAVVVQSGEDAPKPEAEAIPAPIAPAPPVATNPRPTWSVINQPKGESSPMDPDRRVRVAAIGTGGIFRGAHLPCYPEIAQAQMVAFCDPDKKAQDLAYARFASLTEARIERAKEAKDAATIERLKRDLDAIQIYEDISQIISEVKPDLVDICTQPVLHAPLSIQALEAGIHVMCEKPIARSWLETIRLKETVLRSGKIYQHNENWLFDKDYYTAKKLIDAGAIGEPVLMFLATAHGGPEGNPRFWNSDFGGGGALLDNGIHAIGAAWYMSGLDKKPTVVKAADPFGMTIRMPNRIIDGRYQKVTVDDDAHILIRFENAESLAWTTAHVEGSWSHRDSPDTCIIGTTGKIVFQDIENRRYAVVIDSYDREQRRIETSGPTWQFWPSSFYGEILNMVECVRLGVPSISGADFGAECSAVVGAAYLSQKGGRRAVTVEEYKRFALSIAAQYPNDPKAADNALIDAQLAAVRG